MLILICAIPTYISLDWISYVTIIVHANNVNFNLCNFLTYISLKYILYHYLSWNKLYIEEYFFVLGGEINHTLILPQTTNMRNHPFSPLMQLIYFIHHTYCTLIGSTLMFTSCPYYASCQWMPMSGKKWLGSASKDKPKPPFKQ